MLKIENVEIAGWEAAIRGMRNPKNSWERSDSEWNGWDELSFIPDHVPVVIDEDNEKAFCIGPNDMKLMMNLAKGGPVHAKYRRMITVYVDITAPLYWWKEFDTYKVGTVANSCSTMHKIADKKFTLEDFSHEHLCYDELELLKEIIARLNMNRIVFIARNDKQVDRYTVMSDECYAKYKKTLWWQMIQLLPSSYNQKRTICLNYEVLHHIYHDRRNHKLDEWHVVCDWIETLPYSEIITQKVVGIE